jgi:hypothetical protein
MCTSSGGVAELGWRRGGVAPGGRKSLKEADEEEEEAEAEVEVEEAATATTATTSRRSQSHRELPAARRGAKLPAFLFERDRINFFYILE